MSHQHISTLVGVYCEAFPIESASGPPWMFVDVLISVVGGLSEFPFSCSTSLSSEAFTGGGGLLEFPFSTGDFSLGF
ncbi:hypothetical protein F2Q68_00043485 [Brassica cretica]|uniref:Uncharacterized protein n=1 Tax=Brassica cretica TaxID=69181 RepID=A0A8S9LUP5_BRACR|nr:hypothetical protein F2Q68_00043485 [Brassica cretica]